MYMHNYDENMHVQSQKACATRKLGGLECTCTKNVIA